ncbi:synaptic vesicle VAT-1 family membrane protein [Alkalimarinus sediminis]|uniref:Medium chain dehydrogenase/reductase family protein n=1 Tax=Alkalimarinus sediminis TaxID=1632866 RepID=A0A9E8KPJ2_9ALTE|nr:medium chain dehydrogenase/reductase family protein [Alkalimarinus sediminis]UZW74794.1 medium chain dehydrogenase/reductase family protein [Alkalimarinus sediminis]
MKRVMITKAGDIDVLKVQEFPAPSPQDHEVVISTKACGINFADILARQGLYPDAPALPTCVGYEFSGIVTQVGKAVDDSWIGRAVFGLSRFNGYADTVCVPIDQVFEKPDSLTFEQAAAIPVNYLTAWQLLVVMGSLTAEDSLLIHNVGGGVGLAALEIAKHIGATTYGTASPGKHHFLKEKGLDHAIDYRNKDWEQTLKTLTNGRGVELITDPIGGNHWRKSYRSLRDTGRLGMFGISAASDSSWKGKLKLLKTAVQMPFFHPINLMDNNKAVFGVNMGHLWHETPKIRHWMMHIIEGVNDGWVNPHVDCTFNFDQAADAHQYIEERKNKGKVLLTP